MPQPARGGERLAGSAGVRWNGGRLCLCTGHPGAAQLQFRSERLARRA